MSLERLLFDEPEFPGQVDDAECEAVGLICSNGGYCRYGQVTIGVENGFEPELICSCPLDWTGPSCNIPQKQCGTSILYCYNNGSCVQSSGDEFVCDCSTALYEDSAGVLRIFSGISCEYPHNTVCDTNNSLLDVIATGSFCANNGICVASNHDEFECLCPSNWEGDHCEFRVSVDEQGNPIGDNYSDDKSSSSLSVTIIIGVSIASVLFFALVVVCFRRYTARGETNETNVNLKSNSHVVRYGKEDSFPNNHMI